jgi:hypothetical protein
MVVKMSLQQQPRLKQTSLTRSWMTTMVEQLQQPDGLHVLDVVRTIVVCVLLPLKFSCFIWSGCPLYIHKGR